MIEIPPDYDFAQLLDSHCKNCLNDYAPDNQDQLRTLKARGGKNPNEAEVTSRFTQTCQECFKQGNLLSEAIIDTMSCLYRVGINSSQHSKDTKKNNQEF